MLMLDPPTSQQTSLSDLPSSVSGWKHHVPSCHLQSRGHALTAQLRAGGGGGGGGLHTWEGGMEEPNAGVESDWWSALAETCVQNHLLNPHDTPPPRINSASERQRPHGQHAMQGVSATRRDSGGKEIKG